MLTQLRGMTYTQAQRLVLVVGVVIVAAVAGVMYARRVETVEVVAVLLFAPVFAALLRWDELGGAGAAVVAAAIYVGLRWSAIQAVGAGKFSGLIVSRVVGFALFGVAGGLANRQLRASLTKLELYDQIDDDTTLFNARFFVSETDLEMSRATRYRTIFAVSVVDVPDAWLEGLSRAQRKRVLRDLGRLLASSVRTVDRVVHAHASGMHRFAVILPETGGDGARVFSERLRTRVSEWLAGRGVRGDGEPGLSVLTYPEDEAGLQRLREDFAALDQAEHPLSPPAPPGGENT